MKFNDVASLKSFAKKDGSLGQLTQEDWYRGFAPNAGKEEAGTLRIAALDRTAGAASVKVIEDYPAS